MRTVRVYRDGEPPESAIEARGHTAGEALRAAVGRKGLNLGVGKTTLIERIDSRHRLIEWAKVRLHVIEDARSGPTKTHAERQAAGLRPIQVYLSLEASTALDALAGRLGSNRAAIEWALTQAPEPEPS